MAASDGTLVSGVLNGDQAAFAELYDRRGRLIRAICFDTTRDLETAADLTQEVFCRAFSRLDTLRDPQRFGPWLISIAKRVCHEWRRGRLRERRLSVPLPADLALAHPQDAADDHLACLREAVGQLPERHRRSIQAFYLQGLDAEQARTVLGLSKSAFYRALSSARDQLRRMLQRDEVQA